MGLGQMLRYTHRRHHRRLLQRGLRRIHQSVEVYLLRLQDRAQRKHLNTIIPRQPVQGQVQPAGPATVGGHQFSPQALAWMKRCKGFSDTPYDHDGSGHPGGNCTIGFGDLIHAGPCTQKDMQATYPNANVRFMQHAREHEDWVNKNVQVPLTQSQFDSLGSVYFNVRDFKKHDIWSDLQNSSTLNRVPSDIMTLGNGGRGMPYRRAGDANLWNGTYPDLNDPNVCSAPPFTRKK
ncbi:hypothetical protein AciX8_2989 [Granulicella mallensis MP5ACTX8]|uniref:Lysozyme n=2 Tax=Granulicella mallensis TaxID=940614 RepID=G8NRD4_GRAMM|nr:hypothetical protein AciX8_2989 [Granulicella mallensis MP5ACTX8]